VKEFYKENSFGKVNMLEKVYNWVTIPSENYPCDYNKWAKEAIAILESEGEDVGGYLYKIFFFPHVSSCPHIGAAEGYAYHNHKFLSSGTVAHEFGHLLSLGHASSICCYPKFINNYSNCRINEYGNLYDIMGSGGTSYGYPNHFNAVFKSKLDWISEDQIINVTESGTYTLSPLEVADQEIKTLRFRKKIPTKFIM